jgi:hypothetical protein
MLSNKALKQVHPGLRNIHKDRLDDHRRWAAKVSEGIIEGKQDLGIEQMIQSWSTYLKNTLSLTLYFMIPS